VQLYNISLNAPQVEKLYDEGIERIAVNTLDLTGWWELTGNTTDYTGYGRNGNVIGSNSNTMTYSYIHGYTQDPIFDGIVNHNATNMVEGVMNCANINQCSNMSLQHLYVGTENLTGFLAYGGYTTYSWPASYAWNVTLVPNVGSFNGNGYIFAPLNNSFTYNTGTFSVYAWVYLTPNTIGPVIDISGCNPSTSSCASTPIISVNGNTIYAGGSGISTGSITLNSINTWEQITASFNGGHEKIYLDGALAESLGGTLVPSALTGNSYYWTTGCGATCSTPGGVTNTLYGKIANIQFLDDALSSNLASYIYYNNSCGNFVSGACGDFYYSGTIADEWSLAAPYEGLANQTYAYYHIGQEKTGGFGGLEVAYFANNQGICSVASVLENTCGALITQP
jgi:Concanavalin A-like lectin/glucanases superfamily